MQVEFLKHSKQFPSQTEIKNKIKLIKIENDA